MRDSCEFYWTHYPDLSFIREVNLFHRIAWIKHPPHKQQRDWTQSIPDSWKSCHHLLSLMRWSGDESLFLVTCSLCCLSSGVFPAEVWQQLLSERVSGDTALRHGARYNMYHTTQVTHHASHTIRGSNHSHNRRVTIVFLILWITDGSHYHPLPPKVMYCLIYY